jgi:hypothetical protein
MLVPYTTRPRRNEIYGWSDASFADIKSHDGTNRASSIGWLFMCNNGPISWRSTKTPLIALNVAESEIIALSSASQEAIFLRKLANELGFLQTHPTIIYEDCESAVALSKENGFRKRSKHIDVRWSFIVEKQRHGELSFPSTVPLCSQMSFAAPEQLIPSRCFETKFLGIKPRLLHLKMGWHPSMISQGALTRAPPKTCQVLTQTAVMKPNKSKSAKDTLCR